METVTFVSVAPARVVKWSSLKSCFARVFASVVLWKRPTTAYSSPDSRAATSEPIMELRSRSATSISKTSPLAFPSALLKSLNRSISIRKMAATPPRSLHSSSAPCVSSVKIERFGKPVKESCCRSSSICFSADSRPSAMATTSRIRTMQVFSSSEEI